MPQAVLLDLDGTLTDPYPGIRASILHALERLGRPPVGEDVLRATVGPPLEAHLEPSEVDALLLRLLASNSVRSVADEAAAATGLPRRDLYQRALALKEAGDATGD